MLDSNKDSLTELQWNQQLAFINEQLESPRAPGRFVLPITPCSATASSSPIPSSARLGKLFEKHDIDFYLAGHEHNLQHLEIAEWKESFVIAGGGASFPPAFSGRPRFLATSLRIRAFRNQSRSRHRPLY